MTSVTYTMQIFFEMAKQLTNFSHRMVYWGQEYSLYNINTTFWLFETVSMNNNNFFERI